MNGGSVAAMQVEFEVVTLPLYPHQSAASPRPSLQRRDALARANVLALKRQAPYETTSLFDKLLYTLDRLLAPNPL